MRPFRADRPHPLQRRLWIGGTLVGALVCTVMGMMIISGVLNRSGRLELGGDFVPAYAAGTLVREGHATELYDLDSMARVERRIVREANLKPLPFYGPYLNPPFFAAAFAPLSRLPYRAAAAVWLGFNLLCCLGAIALLCRMLPHEGGWRGRGLVPLLVLIPMPFWQAVCHLQNTCLSLLLLCAAVTLWRTADRDRRAFLAGAILGLLLYKPQIACGIGTVLVVSQGTAALAGLCATATALSLYTWVALPGTIGAYLHRLPPLVRWIQERPEYNWGRQVTPTGFWRLLLNGHIGGPAGGVVQILSAVTMIAATMALAIVVWKSRTRPFESRDRLIAAAVAVVPLLVPYYMDYDLLLLAAPATLLAAERCAGPRRETGVDLAMIGWAILFFALYINPAVSAASRINLAAPAVFLVGMMTVLRCARRTKLQSAARDLPTAAIARAA